MAKIEMKFRNPDIKYKYFILNTYYWLHRQDVGNVCI